jgi:menaquinone-dependent protoporphyrinogen IX oxidase
MAKKNFGIPDDVLSEIVKRDRKCVYCRKDMIYPYERQNVCDSATIEHLSPHPPFHWSDRMKANNIAMCCGSCNSSRREKELVDWFNKTYCIDRNINENTVAEPVKSYLKRQNPQESQ